MPNDTEIAQDKARLWELIDDVSDVHWSEKQPIVDEIDKIIEKYMPSPRCGTR